MAQGTTEYILVAFQITVRIQDSSFTFAITTDSHEYSQCQSAPQITVISLELWRFINCITYLLIKHENRRQRFELCECFLFVL